MWPCTRARPTLEVLVDALPDEGPLMYAPHRGDRYGLEGCRASDKMRSRAFAPEGILRREQGCRSLCGTRVANGARRMGPPDGQMATANVWPWGPGRPQPATAYGGNARRIGG